MNNLSRPRSWRVVAITVLICLPLISVQGQREKFNPDGSFWIIGEPPAAFKDFGGINLNASRNRRMNRPGVNLTNGKWLRFRSLVVNRNNLTFTTVIVGGTSYRFKGTFLRGGVFAAHDLEDVAVLEGTLTKMDGGKVAGEATLRFSYFGGT